MPTPEPSAGGLPWWWFLPYLVVLVAFTGMIVVLIALGVAPLAAVGVPVTLSAVAVRALHHMAKISRPVRAVSDQTNSGDASSNALTPPSLQDS